MTATFRAAMARHGKPEAVRTDRGGGFVAHTKDGDFARVLEAELVDHIVGRSYTDGREQVTIARARELRAHGLSLRAVAARLAAQGRVSRTGRKFLAQQIARMLNQPAPESRRSCWIRASNRTAGHSGVTRRTVCDKSRT